MELGCYSSHRGGTGSDFRVNRFRISADSFRGSKLDCMHPRSGNSLDSPIHYANLGLFSYSGEALVCAICAWLLLGAPHLHSRRRTEPEISDLAFSVALGFLSGFADWLKYSSIFISLIVIAYLALRGWRPRKMKGGVDRCRATKPRHREIQLPVPANLPTIWDHVRA
jgi:hypothetical protein